MRTSSGAYRSVLLKELESVVVTQVLLGMIKPAYVEDADGFGVSLMDTQNKSVFVIPVADAKDAARLSGDLKAWARELINNAIEKVNTELKEIA